jgi:NAD(P)-dependent dehydrogenase (short-subunit alcohol dehydrogenase family)
MPTIVMTGGTSGLGAVAARRLSATAGCRLILGARDVADDRLGARAELLPLDLRTLDAVRRFADDVLARLAGRQVDALVLNAGAIHADVASRTPDGFEPTFAVNHLAHHLLLRLLLPHLADGATVVLTTSGTHDPSERTGFPAPRHADAALLAHPEHDEERDRDPRVAARRAYTASKLCCVLTARALAALPDARARRLAAIAFCPGQTPGTGLVRDLSWPRRLAWRALGATLGGRVPGFTSREAAGGTLAALALGTVRPLGDSCYVTLRRDTLTWREPSALARRDDVARALWDDSAALADATAAVGRSPTSDGLSRD